jgi:uncharacterized protein (TIGR01777 family)
MKGLVNVVVTGGTGFVGSRIVSEALTRGDRVVIPSRDPNRSRIPEGAEGAHWDLDSDDWYGLVDGKDAVVHLAGEQAVGVRWTEETKQRMLDSRVRSTERLVEAMWRAKRRPAVFVCGSAVGYYGPRGDAPVDESGSAGTDFLAEVCKRWEAAARKATEIGVRVVRARLGIVFGRGGGALAEMIKPFKMFVGGPIASGRQVVSWVHIDDAARMFLKAVDDASIEGPVNVTAPNPVTNAELSSAIGAVLHRPSFFRVPESALRIRFGEGADPLVTGQRVLPRVMQEAGFQWRFPEVQPALEDVLVR